MLNHVTNVIKLEGDPERIKAVLEAVKNDKEGIGTIDFNKLIPMPPSLNIESGSRTTEGLKAYTAFVESLTKTDPISPENEMKYLENHPVDAEKWALGRAAYHNKLEYGAHTWYEWCNAHWDTKWNAYNCEPDCAENGELRFCTAWSAPHPVIEALAARFPELSVTHEWADEDIGYNCGCRSYLSGRCCSEYVPDTTVEGITFAAHVMDASPSDWGLYLNAGENAYISLPEGEFEEIEVLGERALFTNERMSRDEIPKGCFCYQLRATDDGTLLSSRFRRRCGRSRCKISKTLRKISKRIRKISKRIRKISK